MAKNQHLLGFGNPAAISCSSSHGHELWLSILILTAYLAAAAAAVLLTSSLLCLECSNISVKPAPKRPPPKAIYSHPSLLLHPNPKPTHTAIPIRTPAPTPPALVFDEINVPVFKVDPRLGRWDAGHRYKMIDHALVGSAFNELSAKYSVCLATQSSLEKLHSLVQVAQHWTGPISAALFAAGDEEFAILQNYIDFLRGCYAPVRERISFHLAFPKERVPSTSSYTNKSSQLNCQEPEASLGILLKLRSADVVRWRKKKPYPQNHMRNLARKNCQSPQVFLTDVDIIPSIDLADGLNNFFKAEHCPGWCAYVIPTYELDDRVRFPKNKTELVRLASQGRARPFHHEVLINNQYATNFSRWERNTQVNSLHVSHSVTNFEFLYEPFYVAHDLVPQHDEHFIGYGFTRNTQVYEMYVAGYEFFVLSPVFTIHLGLRKKKGIWRTPERRWQNNINHRNFDQFKLEVFARYRRDPLNMIALKTSSGDPTPPSSSCWRCFNGIP